MIDRINWNAASGAVAWAHENRVCFAVPLDGAPINNAILVFSTLANAWAGYDVGDAVKVASGRKFTQGGAVRQGFVSTDGFICQLESGYHDDVGTEDGYITHGPIESLVRTRGYGGRAAGVKRFHRAAWRMRTHHAAYTVTAIQDGHDESQQLASVTEDSVKYRRPYGRDDWNPTNASADFHEPFRESYGLVPPFMVHATSGVTPGLMQDHQQECRMRRAGDYVQLEFRATRGRIELAGATVDAQRVIVSSGTRS